MEAIEDTELFEFSTQHFDSDSYRIEGRLNEVGCNNRMSRFHWLLCDKKMLTAKAGEYMVLINVPMQLITILIQNLLNTKILIFFEEDIAEYKLSP
jgi:hypothetical protein